ncbi:MAG: nucleotidyltransferase family protein [Firmicutes bacterium]|nr:nucleotidyltransferase family protein [Bacillota bacterium]
MKTGCVLMAAGTASRFGENKLIYPIEGRAMVERALCAAPASLFDRAVAVVSDPIVAERAASAGYACVYNPDPKAGQGVTVSLGAKAMHGMDAVLFCVADQPYLTADSVRRVLAAYAPGRIVALAFAGRRGNPVLFPGGLLPALAGLAPHQTGKKVIASHPERLFLVEASSARELRDIDTRADIRAGDTQ